MHGIAPRVQYGWSSRDPLMTVGSGAVLELSFRDASDGQVRPTSAAEELNRHEDGRSNPITGPIVVEGAQPGDVLQVDVLEFEVDTWGWTCSAPGFGLLAQDFPDPILCHWEIRDGFAAALGLRVPTAPFPGVLGTCPAGPGQPFSVIPPRGVGGNLDIRQLVAGATAYLPVELAGAWFGAGDGHARQGDGEVCGSAIETESRGRLRLTLRRDLHLTSPAFETPAEPRAAGAMFGTTGVEPDLMLASQNAVRRMIEWLVPRYGVTPEDAYLLCSVLVDLRISEVVDAPNWVVTAFFPLDLVERTR
ncbi:MAG: acetamidase [Chloroflexi bacterium]|nr:acetamidase [Chloroflexota bacterium]